MPTLGLCQRRSVCVVLWVPVRGGLVYVVLESPNAGIAPVNVVLDVPIHIELAIVVVRSHNADVGPVSFWVPPKLVVSSLTYPFAVCWHASIWGNLGNWSWESPFAVGWLVLSLRFPTSALDFTCRFFGGVVHVVFVLWVVNCHWWWKKEARRTWRASHCLGPFFLSHLYHPLPHCCR